MKKFEFEFEKWDVQCLLSILTDIKNYGYKYCRLELWVDEDDNKKMITILALDEYSETDFGSVKDGDDQIYN